MAHYNFRLAALRRELGLTQVQFTKAFEKQTGKKLSVGTVSQYEGNKRKPPIEVYMEIAEFFNVSVDFLISETNDRELPNDGIVLNEREIELIQNFRDMSDFEKGEIVGISKAYATAAKKSEMQGQRMA